MSEQQQVRGTLSLRWRERRRARRQEAFERELFRGRARDRGCVLDLERLPASLLSRILVFPRRRGWWWR